jgi:predicted dithiol-disulfide oxidoreductase (DUF899 family)
MTGASANQNGPAAGAGNAPSRTSAVDRASFTAELVALRVRDKAHTHDGDAIATSRRLLRAGQVDADLTVSGSDGPITLLDAFEGR